MTTYTRQGIERMKATERPKVRCKYNCNYVSEDKEITPGTKETSGRIAVDGNNPWIEIWAGGKWIAERFSWSLVLEVINDVHAPPIGFNTVVEYEH